MIDTPGFDDTSRSDAEIFNEIAFFLARIYERGHRLSGIIYLHRITDPRVSGSALKNLEVFKRLCGHQAFSLIRLVTTRWNDVRDKAEFWEQAEQREIQLSQDDRFWADLIRKGSQVVRHDGTEASARAIVAEIVNRGHREVLNVQSEMVDMNLALEKTTAGMFLSQEYDRLQQKYEAELGELQEEKLRAISERDMDGAKALEDQEKEFSARKEQGHADQKQLQMSFEKLKEVKIPELKRRVQAQAVEGTENSQNIDLQVLQANVEQLQEDKERDAREREREKREQKRKERELQAEIARLRQEQEFSRAPPERRSTREQVIAELESPHHRASQQHHTRSQKETKQQHLMKKSLRIPEPITIQAVSFRNDPMKWFWNNVVFGA